LGGARGRAKSAAAFLRQDAFRLAHGAPEFFLVAVHVGAVDEAVAVFERGVDGVETDFALERVGA